MISNPTDQEILKEIQKSVRNSNSRDFHRAAERAKTELPNEQEAICNNLWLFAGSFLQQDTRQFFLKHQALWENFFFTTPLTREYGAVIPLGAYTKALIEKNVDFDKIAPLFDLLIDQLITHYPRTHFKDIPQHLDPLLKLGDHYGQQREDYIQSALERIGAGILHKLATEDKNNAFISTTHLIMKYAPASFGALSHDQWAPGLLQHSKTQQLIDEMAAKYQNQILHDEVGYAGSVSKPRKI